MASAVRRPGGKAGLRAGPRSPAAPARSALRLLPSGPDRVRWFASRGARTGRHAGLPGTVTSLRDENDRPAAMLTQGTWAVNAGRSTPRPGVEAQRARAVGAHEEQPP